LAEVHAVSKAEDEEQLVSKTSKILYRGQVKRKSRSKELQELDLQDQRLNSDLQEAKLCFRSKYARLPWPFFKKEEKVKDQEVGDLPFEEPHVFSAPRCP
jgi:hypothetical protein